MALAAARLGTPHLLDGIAAAIAVKPGHFQ
jgi:hypothetical protein